MIPGLGFLLLLPESTLSGTARADAAIESWRGDPHGVVWSG